MTRTPIAATSVTDLLEKGERARVYLLQPEPRFPLLSICGASVLTEAGQDGITAKGQMV